MCQINYYLKVSRSLKERRWPQLWEYNDEVVVSVVTSFHSLTHQQILCSISNKDKRKYWEAKIRNCSLFILKTDSKWWSCWLFFCGLLIPVFEFMDQFWCGPDNMQQTVALSSCRTCSAFGFMLNMLNTIFCSFRLYHTAQRFVCF